MMQKPQYRKPVRSLYALGLSDDGADVNAHHKWGETALIWAADYGTPFVVRALLARGAKVEARDKYGCTALHYAVGGGRERNVRILLAAGADVNARENDGYTPLMDGHSVRITNMLLRRGANVNAATKNGWTPLMHTLLSGTPAQTSLLLRAGANVQARDEEGKTPLLLVASYLNGFSHLDDMEYTRLLLAYGANVNNRDGEGRSVLYRVVHRLGYAPKAHEVANLLLRAGAAAANEEGDRLLAWTKRNGYEEAAALLIAAGAKEQHGQMNNLKQADPKLDNVPEA